ncbi:hypothetical protein ACFX2I_047218 [Malus domestica]
MGIDPVTHKPYSQILSDYGNISGLPSTAGNHSFSSLFKQSKSAFAPELNSSCIRDRATHSLSARHRGESFVEARPSGDQSSSKRSRAAEVHNLSKKRMRSRINEKMKALQNLIPNSNKTDKASMLDEAIEYLKQLQLQVQIHARKDASSMGDLACK